MIAHQAGLIYKKGSGGKAVSTPAENEDAEEDDEHNAKIAVFTKMATTWINEENFGLRHVRKASSGGDLGVA